MTLYDNCDIAVDQIYLTVFLIAAISINDVHYKQL